MRFGKKYVMNYLGNMFQRFKYIFKNNQKYIYIMKQKYAKRTIKDITNYKKHFFYFALFSLFVTILAFYKIQTIPDYLVMIFALFFHVIAVIGSFFHKDNCINISDLAFNIFMVIGIIYIKTQSILYYLIFMNILTLVTRYIYKGCLFKLSTVKSHRLLSPRLSGDLLHMILIILILLKLCIINGNFRK
jgi:hypothetical protein